MITFDRPKNFDLAGGTGETQIESELRKVGAQILPPQGSKARTSFVCEVPPGFPIGAVCRLVREGLDAERGTALVARLQDGKVFAWPIAETTEARKLPRWAAIVFDAAALAPPPAAKAAPKAPIKPPAPKATPVKATPAPASPVPAAKAGAKAPPPAAKAAPAPAAKAAPKAPEKPKAVAKPTPVPAKPTSTKPAPKAAVKAPPKAAKPAPKAAKPAAKKPAPPMRAAAKKVTKPAVKAKKR